jgi:hypothetical protein
MSTQFKSREDAFRRGFCLAGREDLKKLSLNEMLEHEDIEVDTHTRIIYFGHDIEDPIVLGFVNTDGFIVRIASCKLRDGYDLWFINDVISRRM